MIQINDTISYEPGLKLQLQNEAFKQWFLENCQQKITFGNGKNGTGQTCTSFDKFGRPSTWNILNIRITAVYYTENENYNFNTFIIN